MAIVWPCRLGVEEYADAGREVAVPRPRCPACRGPLIFWSGYWRFIRRAGASRRIWVRRARCCRCRVSHALLPVFLLLRRLDPAAVIGSAVAKMVGRAGARPTAEALAVPHTTARDWRRRHRARAPDWLAVAERRIVELGGELPRWPADVEAAALEALLTAWRRAAARAGAEPLGLWQFVSAVSGGGWLSTTTTPPWAGRARRSFITTTSPATP